MKKFFNFLLITITGSMLVLSCGDDDSGNPTGTEPTVIATPGTITAAPGTVIDFVVFVAAIDGFAPVSATANDGISGEQNITLAVAGNTGTGNFQYTVDPAAVPGTTIDIVFQARDNQNPSKSGDFTATITVSNSTIVTITDADLVGSTTYNWTNDKEYLLDGLVYLEEGGVLNIEAGTIVKATANNTQGDNTTALIITKGAQIFATGTASEPVIFTAESDDFDGNLDQNDVSLWGGLILLGEAPMRANGASTGQIEGIDISEPRGSFGGDIEDDNSGTLTYVSIRHSGVGIAAGKEIQGLTLGAVGSGTNIDYVEIFASDDDGIEFFGGTVEINHAVVAFARDDSFDWDLGYRGGGQFWFAIQDDNSNHACECDGAEPDNESLWSIPIVYNATFIGSGATSGAGGNSPAIYLRDNTGGTIANSIITDFPDKGIELEDIGASNDDAYSRLPGGNNPAGADQVDLSSNIWFIGGKTAVDGTSNGVILITDGADDVDATDLIGHLTGTNNALLDGTMTDDALTSISRVPGSGQLDPRPDTSLSGQNLSSGAPVTTDYHGAFDPSTDLWIKGWTALDEKGFLP